MNPLKVILYIFGIIVSIIIISAFILSFTNLNAAAIEAGIPESLAWLFPLNLDLFLLCASIFILYGNLTGESTKIGWIVLVAFTGVSTAFNMAHSPVDSLSRVSHAVSPIALCISVELLMLILHYTIKHETTDHVADIPAPVYDAQLEKYVDDIPFQNACDLSGIQFPEKVDEPFVATGGGGGCATVKWTEPIKRTEKGEMIKQFFADNPDSTTEECHKQFGFSRTTINKHRLQMIMNDTG